MHIDNAKKIYLTQNKCKFSKSQVYIHQINTKFLKTMCTKLYIYVNLLQYKLLNIHI